MITKVLTTTPAAVQEALAALPVPDIGGQECLVIIMGVNDIGDAVASHEAIENVDQQRKNVLRLLNIMVRRHVDRHGAPTTVPTKEMEDISGWSLKLGKTALDELTLTVEPPPGKVWVPRIIQ